MGSDSLKESDSALAGQLEQDYGEVQASIVFSKHSAIGPEKQMLQMTQEALNKLRRDVRKAIYPTSRRLMSSTRSVMNGLE